MSALSEGWEEIAPAEGYDDVWAMPTETDQSFIAKAQRASSAERPDFHWDTDACNYHRNNSGRWVVIGPVELVTEGFVDVRCKSGKMCTEQVLGLGEPFDFRGRQYRYGYIAQRQSPARRSRRPHTSYRSQEDTARSYARQYGAAV